MIELLLRALFGGLGVALLAGPLGCFMVWRRMSYFGDTLAHSALLGVTFGILFDLNLNLAIILCSALLALALVMLQQQREIATDTLLGILSHSSLAIGIVGISFAPEVRVDLMGYLFGDLLSVTSQDLLWIYGGGSLVLLTLLWFWRPLLLMTLHEELAEVEGVAVRRMRLLLMLMVAVVIAIAMKIVGVLLITSLLLIPAAAVRNLAETPERMAVLASVAGCVAVACGLSFSYWLDTPTGPSIVLCAFVLFLLTFVLRKPLRQLLMPQPHPAASETAQDGSPSV